MSETHIRQLLPADIYQAAINANAPSAANPFATMADIGGGGGGTVTNFSSGNLSPLFTTAVATATTTPALTFTLTNAGANTYFGNATGGSAAPSYTAAGTLSKTDDTNVTLTLGGSPLTSLLASVSLTVGWTGSLAIARGGSGQTTANNALNAFLPSQATNSGKFLQTDGTNTSWVAGNSGTVTSFSSGNLSPLFTTSVGTSTTTPALTFALSNAAANSWFGNNTGGATSPSYNSAGALTASNDTNITLALGGTPTTSLLNAVSLTLGWVGSLAVGRGGTGFTTYTIGDILYANSTTTFAKLAGVATGNAIISSGVGAAPLYGKIGLTTHVSGILPIANGGRNNTTAVTNGVDYYDGTKFTTIASFVFDGTNLGVGVVPQSLLTVSRQSTIQAPISDTTVHFVGLDANPLRVTLDTHNTGTAGGIFLGRRSRGTSTTPTAVASADTLFSINTVGYGATGYGAVSTGLISFKAAENFTDSAQGTQLSIFTTPTGSTTAAETFRISAGGPVTVGTWNATQIGAIYGGTGQTTVTTGDLLYGSASNVWSKLAGVAVGSYLRSGGVTTAPLWSTLTLPNTSTDTQVFFSDGANTMSTNANLAFNKTTSTTSTTKGILQLGSNTYNARPGIAATWDSVASQSADFYIMGGLIANNFASFHYTTPATTNYAYFQSSTITGLNNPSQIDLRIGGTSKYNATTSTNSMANQQFTFIGVATSSGSSDVFKFTTPLSTSQLASTETMGFNFDMTSNSIQHATGTLALNRDIYVQARTHRFVGSSAFGATYVATVSITGGPILGTNATGTTGTSTALNIEAGAVGTFLNSYGLTVNAQTGATNNFAAQFLGGSTKFAAGTTTYAPITLISGTNKTTASAGDIEYNGTNLFFTRTGTTRENILVGNDAATAPTTDNIGVILDYYGTSATRVLTTPNSWASVVINGVTYKIALYS